MTIEFINPGSNLNEYLPRMRRIIQRIAKDEYLVDDIIQECCLRLMEKEDLWDDRKGKFVSWLNKVVKNTTLNYLQKEKRVRNQQLEDYHVPTTPSGEEITQEDVQWLWRHFNCLTRSQKEILLLKYFEGLNSFDISHVLNISPSTVRAHLRAALTSLRSKAGTGRLLALLLPVGLHDTPVFNGLQNVFNASATKLMVTAGLVSMFGGMAYYAHVKSEEATRLRLHQDQIALRNKKMAREADRTEVTLRQLRKRGVSHRFENDNLRRVVTLHELEMENLRAMNENLKKKLASKFTMLDLTTTKKGKIKGLQGVFEQHGKKKNEDGVGGAFEGEVKPTLFHEALNQYKEELSKKLFPEGPPEVDAETETDVAAKEEYDKALAEKVEELEAKAIAARVETFVDSLELDEDLRDKILETVHQENKKLNEYVNNWVKEEFGQDYLDSETFDVYATSFQIYEKANKYLATLKEGTTDLSFYSDLTEEQQAAFNKTFRSPSRVGIRFDSKGFHLDTFNLYTSPIETVSVTLNEDSK